MCVCVSLWTNKLRLHASRDTNIYSIDFVQKSQMLDDKPFDSIHSMRWFIYISLDHCFIILIITKNPTAKIDTPDINTDPTTLFTSNNNKKINTKYQSIQIAHNERVRYKIVIINNQKRLNCRKFSSRHKRVKCRH